MHRFTGYTAIIVHNVGSNDTEVMGVEDPSQIIIYSTFVGEYDGMLLKNFSYFNRKGYYVRIQDEFNINVYIWPFAVVVGLCFIVMIFFMVRLVRNHIILMTYLLLLLLALLSHCGFAQCNIRMHLSLFSSPWSVFSLGAEF